MRSLVITVALAAALVAGLAAPQSVQAQGSGAQAPASETAAPQTPAHQTPAPQSPASQTPAMVEGTLVFTPEATAECLSISRPIERAPCIGLAAQACIEQSPGGDTAPGRIACFTAETAFWESLIAASVDQDAALADMTSAAQAGSGAPAPDSEAVRDEATGDEATGDETVRDEGHADGGAQGPLDRVQTAWVSYRDALCDATAQRRGEGAARATAQAECRLSETARHALWLEQFVGVGP